MAHAEGAQPVGGPLLTRPYKWLLGILVVWGLVLIWRFAAGIGAVSGLTDGYPWGVWIAFDVVTGTALGCGGYAIAILAYILNKGQYHPVVRPAILTSALGYSMAALAIVIDVGRPWYIWAIPIGGIPPNSFGFNWHSPLLEVALCVMAYVFVLWIELSPAFMEKWKDSSSGFLRSFSEVGLKVMDKILIIVIAVGLLLPTMHQSSLGAVMLLAGHKLHPLWFTPFIPLLFLISCVGMGYAVVVWESAVSSSVFKRKRETTMLSSLSGVMIIVNVLYLVIRFGDIIISGKTGLMFTDGFMSLLFWIEIALFVIPIFIFAGKKARENFNTMFKGAFLLMLAGSVYRFNAYIVAYNPGENWNYFPSVPELFITLGVIALEIALYIYIVKTFPILGGVPATRTAEAEGGP
jgi:Ni/Fe-hydrogenase subunit HybB-like protein